MISRQAEPHADFDEIAITTARVNEILRWILETAQVNARKLVTASLNYSTCSSI